MARKWAKSTSQNSKFTGIRLAHHRQVLALLQYHLIDLAGENSLSENKLEKRFPQDHQSMVQSPWHTSCRLLQDHTHVYSNNISFLKSCLQCLNRTVLYHRYHSFTTLFKLNETQQPSFYLFILTSLLFFFNVTAAFQHWTYVSIENGTMIVALNQPKSFNKWLSFDLLSLL